MIKDNSKMTDKMSVKMGKGFADEGLIESNVIIKLFDENGNLKDQREIHNLVTTAGKEGSADQILAAPTLPKPGWMAIGTGSPAATLLGAEIDRNALTSKTRSGAVVTMVADWAAGDGTGAITEAGVFDVVTANTVNMWMSASFAVVNKGALDTLQISWTLTFS
jgi:hypothetical protein